MLPYLAATVLALATVEGLAYWWMHPPPTGRDQPVLVWRPSPRPHGAQGAQNAQPNPIPEELDATPTETVTPLPDLAAKSIEGLRCSNGEVARLDRDDGLSIHMAFFEWDALLSSSVMEAYKHFPEQCLGSVGMTLVEHRGSHPYRVGDTTILFEHSVMREPRGPLVHTFKGIWVSGANRLIGDETCSLGDQARRIRWQAAFKRFRPAHARVVQGAVRGTSNPNQAWTAFQDAMLKDLGMSY